MRVTIAVSVLLTFGTVVVIYSGWVRSRFPTSCIQFIPVPGETFEGVQVTVSDGERPVAEVTLGKDPVPVLVEPGLYRVTTSYHGVRTTQQVMVPNRRLVSIALSNRQAGPAMPGAAGAAGANDSRDAADAR